MENSFVCRGKIRACGKVLLLAIVVGAFSPVYGWGEKRERTTTLEGRTAFEIKLKDSILAPAYVAEEVVLERLNGAFWGIYAFNQTGEVVESLIASSIDAYGQLPTRERYGLLSVLQSKERLSNQQLVGQLLRQESDPKLRALLVAHSGLAGYSFSPEWSYLTQLDHAGEVEQATLQALFDELASRQQTNLVLVCNSDRDIPAKLYVVDPARGGVQEEWYSYLARSATNLLPYFTNGNTPAGVFRIKSFGSMSENVFIGKTPVVVTELPFECAMNDYSLPYAGIENPTDEQWAVLYESLLPVGLAGYSFMWQAYWAGKMGRGEIIIHGSTIDARFFLEESYYPLTPSLGCVCALEIYNQANGALLESHQRRLVEELNRCQLPLGYLYVVPVKKERVGGNE